MSNSSKIITNKPCKFRLRNFQLWGFFSALTLYLGTGIKFVNDSEELAYTLNITKDEAAYLANKYKPQVTLTANSLQVR